MELMFNSHLSSWTPQWGVTQGDGGGWAWVPPEFHSHLHCLESIEIWRQWTCSDSTRSPDGQSPTCRRNHPHQRLAQWGWCRLQTLWSWPTNDWRGRCSCTGRRVEGKGRSLEGNRCWWSGSQRHVSPASHAASCWTRGLWSTCRWSRARSVGRARPAAEPGWLCSTRQSWNPGKGAWHRFLRHPGAGGWSGGPCWWHHLQTCWLCRQTAGVQEWVNYGFEMGHHMALEWLHYHRGLGDGPVVIKNCDPWLFGDRDDGGGFKAGHGMSPVRCWRCLWSPEMADLDCFRVEEIPLCKSHAPDYLS